MRNLVEDTADSSIEGLELMNYILAVNVSKDTYDNKKLLISTICSLKDVIHLRVVYDNRESRMENLRFNSDMSSFPRFDVKKF